ncbi:Response regulator PleD [Stutzerimonas frequens]|uniref:GGDEF domain-containing protein n=1 Tax=Stutzerimonas frequens TaxID=2968969 RepID=UPI0007B96C4C|nr:GGDEF domain-containing protein [Stutzerimonas frequens]KZX64775.1 diguanylate cyclase [Stutzerimonas frequens]MEC7474086.1 GGDEF domain-containing protein [Pseudomonadota bacterium]QFU13120.1 Response regulator PleD [Stutzerimonas frequens]
MHLDVPTLTLVDIYVLLLLGVLMFCAWRSGQRDSTLGCTCLMLLFGTVSTVLGSLRGLGIDVVPIVLGNIALQLALAMNWTAMRTFAGRRPYLPGIVAGALLWGGLCLVPVFYSSLTARLLLASALTVIYTALAMFELWRSRQQISVSLRPAIGLMMFHMAFYLLRMAVDRGQPFGDPEAVSFFAFVIFETLLYAIGISFVTLAMVRERAEQQYRHASLSDPLTGIGNRRSFIDAGQALLQRGRLRGEPVALLLCDLDFFKRLNDTFGHQAGDRALIDFGQVIARRMRRQDVFGRIGGEEFACLLADANALVAREVAERIRAEFAAMPFAEQGRLSVSIGVATTTSRYELDELLAQADRALYVAKAAGRNCTRLACEDGRALVETATAARGAPGGEL